MFLLLVGSVHKEKNVLQFPCNLLKAESFFKNTSIYPIIKKRERLIFQRLSLSFYSSPKKKLISSFKMIKNIDLFLMKRGRTFFNRPSFIFNHIISLCRIREVGESFVQLKSHNMQKSDQYINLISSKDNNTTSYLPETKII